MREILANPLVDSLMLLLLLSTLSTAFCPLQRQRRAVEAVYEARPVPGDHKVPDMHGARYDVT